MFDFRLFPGTNFNRINLDWILAELGILKEGQDTVEEAAEQATEAATEATQAAVDASQAAADAIEAIETVTEQATQALSTANSANTTANGAAEVAATAQQIANSANTAAVTAQQTADGAVTAAATAQQTADGAVTAAATAQQTADGAVTAAGLLETSKIDRSAFDLTAHTGAISNFVETGNATVGSISLNYAFNEDYSIGKIYGNFTATIDANGWANLKTNIRVKGSRNFYITNAGFLIRATSTITGYNILGNNIDRISLSDTQLYIDADGILYIRVYLRTGVTNYALYWPCLYFFDDFGDT